MTKWVCDICMESKPNTIIEYKYRAKQDQRHLFLSSLEGSWKRIELCQSCLDKIIKAKEGGIKNDNEWSH